jgi:hypothetical protein
MCDAGREGGRVEREERREGGREGGRKGSIPSERIACPVRRRTSQGRVMLGRMRIKSPGCKAEDGTASVWEGGRKGGREGGRE